VCAAMRPPRTPHVPPRLHHIQRVCKPTRQLLCIPVRFTTASISSGSTTGVKMRTRFSLAPLRL
jgi:hypothetical protein